MAKYRNLTEEELKEFEKEFIDYLVVNGIVAEDWEKMKIEDNEKAMKIVDLFSDVIIESVLRKIKFVDIRTKSYVQAVQCLPDKMLMVAISCKDEAYDMSDFKLDRLKDVLDDSFQIYTGEKKYTEEREKELFEMTLQGYNVSDGAMYKSLQIALAE